MDFDDDGILDLISGSYDPGEFYLFRGKGLGVFAKRETILDKNGKPVLTRPNQKNEMESFGTWITTVDWESDGDLDLILGTYDGELMVRINVGTRAKPQFAEENISIKVNDKKVSVPDHHAAPVVADWDGDGRWDILSGSDNGGVYWLRNVGDKQAPKFEALKPVFAKHDGIGYDELIVDDSQARPGIRSQIAVHDYNGDGKLDLLVGDFCTNVSPREDLTDEEQKELQSLYEKIMANVRINEGAWKKFMSDFHEEFPIEEGYSDEVNEIWQERYEKYKENERVKKLNAENEKLQKQRNKYLQPVVSAEEKKKSLSDWFNSLKNKKKSEELIKYDTCHGYVWLILRK